MPQLKAIIDLDNLGINVELGVQVPIVGYVKITSVSSNLKTGVKISFDAFVASGSVTLTLRNGKEVWISYTFKALGKQYSGETKIFTLP